MKNCERQIFFASGGVHGYAAVDMENQIDMAGAERTLAFCNAVEQNETDEMTMIVLAGPGFHK